MITKNAELIPVFTSQLEKAKEATDAANIRAAYAEVVSTALTDQLPTDMSVYDVDLTQGTSDWQSTITWPDNFKLTGTVDKGKSVGFTYNTTTGEVTGTVK